MLKVSRMINIRRSMLISIVIALPACGNLALPSGNDQQVRDLLAFQQELDSQGADQLTREAQALRAQLEESETPAQRLRLQMVEQRLEHLAALDTERSRQQSLRNEIQSLTEQIQALTAIEQQMNRREQRQESSNGAR